MGLEKDFSPLDKDLNKETPFPPFILGSQILFRLLNSLFDYPEFVPFSMSIKDPKLITSHMWMTLSFFCGAKSKSLKLVIKKSIYENISGQKVSEN